MKHFFDRIVEFDNAAKLELLKSAREELKKRPMKIEEMNSKMGVVCFNASAVNDYIPVGMEDLIAVRSILIEQSISEKFVRDVQRIVKEETREILAYIVADIRQGEIVGYLNFLFRLQRDFTFEANTIFHLSNAKLIEYLKRFLDSANTDRTPRKIDVYDSKGSTAWKTVAESKDLFSVDMGVRAPVILDRPFFTEIHLTIVRNHVAKTYGYPLGKLNSVVGHFNKKRGPGGVLKRSSNTLFLTWKDIAGFKLASDQSKTLLAISFKGEVVAANRIISRNINLNLITIEEIDFFRFKIGGKAIDIKPKELTEIEVHLDTRQIIFMRGIGEGENHISRFNRLVLHKGDQAMQVNRVVPFERGESNFLIVQTFLGARYTEYERARQIGKSRKELDYLSTRNIVSGDIMSHMALSSMQLLGVLPMEARCTGFGPQHVNNAPAVEEMFAKWFEELKSIFADIIDMSQSPEFTKRNFARQLQQMQAFLKKESVADITDDTLQDLAQELENLIAYMDDFFKLDIYRDFEKDLECETIPAEGQPLEEEEEASASSVRIDQDTKDFIHENFAFFQKRDMVQKAILKIERMLFYNRHVRRFAEDRNSEPDMIVYSSAKFLSENFRHAAYPAVAMDEVFDRGILQSESEESDLLFVKFMRTFTQKVHCKAQELNKSFHHQYKHTLAEMQFVATEQLQSLQNELSLLEDPANKEQAYVQLLEKLTRLYHKHLKEKKESLELINEERKAVQAEKEKRIALLADLLQTAIEPEMVATVLDSMPDRMERMRRELVQRFAEKKDEVTALLLAYSKFYASISRYYGKILRYASWFQKALLVRRKHQMYVAVKEQSKGLWDMRPKELVGLIGRLKRKSYNAEREKKALLLINQNTRQLRELLLTLKEKSISGMFRERTWSREKLLQHIEYFAAEATKLGERAEGLAPLYQRLKSLEDTIFQQLKEITNRRVAYLQNRLLLQTANLISQYPKRRDKVDTLLKASESVPKKIKDELGGLRGQMKEAFASFSKTVEPHQLKKVVHFSHLLDFAHRKEEIYSTAKEIVNYSQGEIGLKAEIEEEEQDLRHLVSQEKNLEKVAMSKALPSTRILLKSQYIPLVEGKIALMARANSFLGEITSCEKKIKEALIATFFRNRYGYLQFCNGVFCIDNQRGARTHTDKNIDGALMLLAEKYKIGLARARETAPSPKLRKAVVVGIEGVEKIISELWDDKGEEQFIILPSNLSMEEVLRLCEYKSQRTEERRRNGKSKNSLILVYISEIDFDKIQNDAAVCKRYHQAVLSNIFIDIDNVDVFNNRQSILEACVKQMFGSSNEKISGQLVQDFLAD